MEQAIDVHADSGSDFYQRLRSRLAKWTDTREGRRYRFADHLLLLPDFVHLMIRLGLDGRVPMQLRTQTAAVLAYVAFPLDLVPEGVVGPTGCIDDLLLVALMAGRLLRTVPPEIVLGLWAGPKDLIRTIQDLLALGAEMVGGRVWGRLQRMVEGDPR